MEKSNLFFEALFNREIASPGTKDVLAQLSEEHPYFSPAQFYLLKQTEQGTNEFNKQLSKTAILFNNNYWLNFLLTETEENTRAKQIAEPVHTPEYDEAAVIIRTEAINAAEEEIFATQPDIDEEVFEEDVPAFINEEITETIVTAPLEEEQLIEEANTDFEAPALEELDIESMEETAVTDFEPAAEELNIETVGETASTDIHTVDEEENEQVEEDSVAGELSAPLIRINTVAETTEDTLVFEPLHTTDYFASVGIKLSEEVKPTDKLGQQLKSFTDWLKTMKKVHSEPQIETTKETEQRIQQLAERSNTNGDIVTEAMADVLLQQGRTEKAIEMLEKLSLLNPLKSAYFAAKIKNLKAE